MGFRFRKSIRLGKGMRINVSKSGLGLSVGRKGATFSVGPRGARSTLSIPGTGMSWVSQSGWGSSGRKSGRKATPSYMAYSPSYEEGPASDRFFRVAVSRPGNWGVVIGIILLAWSPLGLAVVVGSLIWNHYEARKPTVAWKLAFNKAINPLNQKRWADGLRYLKKAQEADPENSLILKAFTQTYFKMGDVAGGADFLRSLLASRPDSPVFRETLGDYLDRWGTEAYENREVDRAIGILEEAQPLVPGRVSTLRTLTFALNDKKEYATAVIYAEKWLTLEDTPDVRAVLGELYAGAYDFEKAIPMLQSASGTVAEDQRIILLGRCFLEKGQVDLAIETFKQGPVNKRKMDPEVMEAKYWLGVAYLKAGQKAKAKTQFAKVYAEDVNYKEIKQLAAEVGLTKEGSPAIPDDSPSEVGSGPG